LVGIAPLRFLRPFLPVTLCIIMRGGKRPSARTTVFSPLLVEHPVHILSTRFAGQFLPHIMHMHMHMHM
jgi:hypothetical protein